MDLSPIAWINPQGIPFMFFYRMERPSTFPDATWRSAKPPSRQSVASTRSFVSAGDDVDTCWRLQQKGWTLGFSPAAMVWHHRRNSIRQFWKQQLNYGRAEAMLERKWPDKYNGAGHLTWVGRVYGNEFQFTLGLRDRIYHGTWGSAPFQSLYQPAPSLLAALLTLPEWYLVNIALVALSAIGILWKPFLMALPMLGLSAGLPFIHVVIRVARLRCKTKPQRYFHRLKFRLVTAFVHMLQPLARLYGRLMWGLTPWRRSLTGFYPPWPSGFTLWSQRWQAAEERLQLLEATLRTERAVVLRGGAYDRWDLEVRGGFVGATRTQMVIEEHGAGQQYIRFRFWPRCSPTWVVFTTLFAYLSAWAALDQAWSASGVAGDNHRPDGTSPGARLRRRDRRPHPRRQTIKR